MIPTHLKFRVAHWLCKWAFWVFISTWGLLGTGACQRCSILFFFSTPACRICGCLSLLPHCCKTKGIVLMVFFLRILCHCIIFFFLLLVHITQLVELCSCLALLCFNSGYQKLPNQWCGCVGFHALLELLALW